MYWDDILSTDLVLKWNKIVGHSDHRISRRYFIDDITDPFDKIYLHGFSENSKEAYGAVVYIKAKSRSGFIVTSLVLSKARVAPIQKKYTIPHLELLSNLVLSR